jgi:small subunit ribosomal protein S24e
MELEIVSKKDNPLLDRLELEVSLKHHGEPTPKRTEVRELVAAAVKSKKDQVVVDHLESTFGKGLTRGYVKVYSTKAAALAIEERPIIVRNQLAPPSEKKAAKKAEKKAEKPSGKPEKKPEKDGEEEPAKEKAKKPAKDADEKPEKDAAKDAAKDNKD